MYLSLVGVRSFLSNIVFKTEFSQNPYKLSSYVWYALDHIFICYGLIQFYFDPNLEAIKAFVVDSFWFFNKNIKITHSYILHLDTSLQGFLGFSPQLKGPLGYYLKISKKKIVNLCFSITSKLFWLFTIYI